MVLYTRQQRRKLEHFKAIQENKFKTKEEKCAVNRIKKTIDKLKYLTKEIHL